MDAKQRISVYICKPDLGILIITSPVTKKNTSKEAEPIEYIVSYLL